MEVWHINTDEPRVLDYNDDIVDPAERNSDFNQPLFDSSTVFRSSDHDPVLIGLDLDESPRTLKMEALDRLTAIGPTGSWWTDFRIQVAAYWLEASLSANLWEDESSLVPRIGQHVFRFEEYAARTLHRLEDAPNGVGDEVVAVLELMVAADFALAEGEIAEAIANDGDQRRIDRAIQRLNQGVYYWEQGRYRRAIQYFRWSWREADKATAGQAHSAI